MTFAFETAEKIVQAYNQANNNCLGSANNRGVYDGCLNTLLKDRGAIIFGHPISTEEQQRYFDIATNNLNLLEAQDAASTALAAMIASPLAVFREEIGEPVDSAGKVLHLDPFEVANALSYILTDNIPDQELWQLAESGQIIDPAVLKLQVQRLLKNRGMEKIKDFVRQYFKYAGAQGVSKTTEGDFNYDPQELVADTDKFVEEIFKNNLQSNFISTLLTSTKGYASEKTYQTYGLAQSPGAVSTLIELPAEQRSGILTQPSFLVAFSKESVNKPVQRGLFIQESLLCGELPRIAASNIPNIPDDPNQTLRERLAIHSAGTCAGCHKMMDPLGLGFEQFDHFGVYRTQEHGTASQSKFIHKGSAVKT